MRNQRLTRYQRVGGGPGGTRVYFALFFENVFIGF